MTRRDEWLRRVARRGRSSDTGWRRAGTAFVLGWLVLMTFWGVGRSGFPDQVQWFLAVGIAAAVVTTVVTWRR